ncbi:transposable element Tc1 transposase [Trichonephila clavipes]|nr:transposable element Tc1 transposase [Trichonephila clavipes]
MPGKRARRHFSQLSEFERGLIIGMKTAGWSTRSVAGQVDRSACVVRNCWEQWAREGTHVRKPGSGATRKTTRREDRRIVRQALVDPTVTLSTIRADVGVAIVLQTISRHLAEANLKSKRPFRALPLTPEHRQLRLQWCQARSMWNDTYWQNVVFSDESRTWEVERGQFYDPVRSLCKLSTNRQYEGLHRLKIDKIIYLKSIIKELDILHNDYCALPDKVNLKDVLDTLSDLQEEAEETKIIFLVLLSNYESKKETVNNTSKNNHVKLPDLSLPTFSGKLQEFEQFKLEFMNLIENNPSLNEVQKLCYRKGALKNEASLTQRDQETFD